MKSNTAHRFIALAVTYVVVKLLQYLAGFEYSPFEEGVFTYKLLADVGAWALVYVLVYSLLKKIYAPKKEAAQKTEI